MAGPNGKNMSVSDFLMVLGRVQTEHAWGQGHYIKYVRPSYDTRTGDIYGVIFEGFRGTAEFFVVNENRDRNLTAWVVEFLDADPKTYVWPNNRS